MYSVKKLVCKIAVVLIAFWATSGVAWSDKSFKIASNEVPLGQKCNNGWGGLGTVLLFPKVDRDVRPIERDRDVRKRMKSPTERSKTISGLGGGASGKRSDRAKKIRENRGSRRFIGVGQASIRNFMLAFEDLEDQILSEDVETRGKIFAYYYNKGASSKKSCMAVNMELKYTNNNRERKVFRYRMHVFFDADVSERVKRDAPNYDPENIFPDFDLIKISEEMVKPKNLKWKIYDSGKSVQITYVDIWNQIDNRWDPVPQTGALARRWYGVDRRNCIDMMFASKPPTHMGLLTSVSYCLGRCEWPPVINTGF